MYRFIVVLALTFLYGNLAGCAAKVWTTTQGNIPDRMRDKIRVFGPTEYPVFIIGNGGGRTAGIDARDRRTDVVVRTSGDRRLRSQLDHLRMPALPPGPYVAELRLDNQHVDTWVFEIAEREQGLRVTGGPGDGEPQEPYFGIRDPRFIDVVDGWRDLPEASKNAIAAIMRTGLDQQ